MADDLDLNEVIEEEVEDATVITVPIDDTLTASGEAADAKAVGDALALKADKSELGTSITVNGQGADAQGVIIVTAEDTAMSGTDETTVKEAVEAAAARTGADIPINGDPGAESIAEVIAGSVDKTADMIAMGAEDPTTVAQAIGTVAAAAEGSVKSVNGTLPDSAGNVQISVVPLANNLTSSSSQSAAGVFVIRTTGGSRSVASGEAYIQEIRGESVHEGYAEEEINWTVNTTGDLAVTNLDRDTFVAYVADSGTITLSYTGSWSENPANYGFTLTGTPVSGDEIVIVYVKETRGTIVNATPTLLRATGWNLYNNATGYARVVNYEHNYHIGGAYTSIAFSSTYGGARNPITVTNGSFSVPGAGWVWVTGGNATDTYITTEWTDWTTGPSVPWEAYSETTIDLSTVMTSYFPNGLFSVGSVYDSIDFGQGVVVSRIERMVYTEENMEAVIASGRAWDADEDYIYAVRVTQVSSSVTLSGTYTVSDHGLEMFDDTETGAFMLVLYGQDLKAKLTSDVLTISQQSLTNEQKTQVKENLGLNNIGTYKTGTNASSLSVASGTDLAASTVSIDTGVWLITGGFQWSTSFDQISIGSLKAGSSVIIGSTVRHTGASGGGCNIAMVYRNTGSSAVTITLNASQYSGSSKTASSVQLRAVRIT